ncbi:glycoside hydrolase family 19 protein [Solimicrobium silvestre]|uniref:Putative chitinase n=1 Tax=Solimicrobium silvestre TaxID=2099400 RepID=A0A2S9GY87_9BURK|nr:glycoside hydrolase family 19 protein [Solimicrobium silvestre]PRC92687.1 putative chitinase [Solimicrobium silvestre]
MDISQLQKIMPLARQRANTFLDPLIAAMSEFEINTPMRQAAFLAQVAHESGQLLYVLELASGEAYEGRKDLGNTQSGDGPRFKGRGLIQITGRTNYAAMSEALKLDCVNHPELLELPTNACRSAGWFWKNHGLNVLADSQSFITITRRINGGTNGLADRQALYAIAKKVLL